MKAGTPFLCIAFTCAAAALTVCASAVAAIPDEGANVASTVEAFHNALAHGDGKAAMNLLASDAVILESGSSETRRQYEEHHLKEDIAFASAVPSTHSILTVQIEGDVAWLVSTSHSNGSFHGREINSVGTELVVLTKSAQGWRIRAIHWSSRNASKNN